MVACTLQIKKLGRVGGEKKKKRKEEKERLHKYSHYLNLTNSIKELLITQYIGHDLVKLYSTLVNFYIPSSTTRGRPLFYSAVLTS